MSPNSVAASPDIAGLFKLQHWERSPSSLEATSYTHDQKNCDGTLRGCPGPAKGCGVIRDY